RARQNLVQETGRPKEIRMKTESSSREGNGRGASGRSAVIRGQALESLERGSLDRGLLLATLQSFKRGDFTVRLPVGLPGIDGKIADAFNDVVELNQRMTAELERVSRAVGKEGRLSQRGFIGGVSGGWSASMGSVNELISDL